MNRSIIIYMLGWIMNMEAIFMTLPVVTAVVYRESIGFIYLGVAAVCGLLIGVERQTRMKGAGSRTHMMVSLGAALMTLVSS